MPPNQQTPAGGHDPYAFIMADAPKQKRAFIPQPKTPKQKLLMGVGLLGVLFLFGIIFTLIFTSGGGATDNMLKIAQTQNEIVRVSDLAIRDLKSAPVLAFAQNTSLTVASDQRKNVAYISEFRKAPAAKELALGQNSQITSKLETASQAGRYDETFYDLMYDELLDYRNQLSETFKTASPKQKELLNGFYNNVNTLLKNQEPPTN